MKLKIFRRLSVFFMIFLLASFPVSAENTFLPQNAEKILLDKVDSYTQTYTYNGFLPTANSSKSGGSVSTFQIDVPRDVYMDEEKNRYEFSDGALILFESQKFIDLTSPDTESVPSNAALISENAAVKNISASPVIAQFVTDFSSFDVVSASAKDPSTTYGGYMIKFEKVITEELSDFITVRTDNSGDILWISVGRCGLEEITQEQKDVLWEQIECYADSMSTHFDFFQCENIYYQKRGDKILGNYTLRFLENREGKEPETVYFGGIIVTIPA